MFNDNRILFIIFVASFLLLLLSCCRKSSKGDVIDDITPNDEENDVDDIEEDFIIQVANVPGHSNLFYNVDTREVCTSVIENGVEYLVEYKINSHSCHYYNGKVFEVSESGEVITIVHPSSLPN